MKIFLVGGAVRDQLLGLQIHERDWVVVGATAEKMLKLGYKPVGKDFPVFLHPKTGEEYALARTERKTAMGYQGFEFNANSSVTLEEDLIRRDLSINAMAQTEEGEIIDPYSGQNDLSAKLLRHVSDAFAEDPVRILRIARFASRFSDFSIHPDTLTLMKSMVSSGEVDALVPERVWKEFSRALLEPSPERFFETLSECGALPIIFPEIDIANTAALKNVTEISDDGPTRFSALTYPLSLDAVKALCQRISVPSDYKEIAVLVANFQKTLKKMDLNNAKHVVGFLEALDCYRRPNRLAKFVLAVAANENMIDSDTIKRKLVEALQLTMNVDAKPFVEQGLKNEAIGEAVRNARIERLKQKRQS